MTEIEQKALELVNEVAAEAHGLPKYTALSRSQDTRLEALCRAIERHEAFRQEVSDAAERLLKIVARERPWLQSDADQFASFIITKPDPLVEALDDVLELRKGFSHAECADRIRAALAKRGLEIREKSE